MPSRPSNAGLEEPWAKRLRRTPSRIAKLSKTGQLLSPRPTHNSSTDDLPLSSSSYEPKAKPKPKTTSISFLQDRLAPPPKTAASHSPIDNVLRPTNKKLASRPSVAPFFQRVEAAFQNSPQIMTDKTIHVKTSAPKPARSPSPDAQELIQELKEHYLQTATSLHKQATARLAQAQADLTRTLTRTFREQDESFLAEAEAQIARLAQPLDNFRIRSSQKLQLQSQDQQQFVEEHTVAELVARAEKQHKEFEADVGRLWQEWAVAEAEVKKLLGGIGASVSCLGVVPDAGPIAGEECEGDDGAAMLKRFAEVIQQGITAAEEAVVELGEEAVGMMKEIEKDFRKTTLPDLHAFFQSLDEP
ncbi:hypothetical protein VTJ83DRAFT_3606 [Remersonia thermophila]|uniref:Uncharacterized protein n=1 Tax=Remersonia thermophila TaxID=72144 RepID=A0ABR4DEH3_9PEZI